MRLLNRKNDGFDELIIYMNRRNLVLTEVNRTSIKKPEKLVLQQTCFLQKYHLIDFRNRVLGNR